MLLVALRAVGRTWPALLAWFLAGWTARLLLLQLAASLGVIQATYGLLILPLAVLVRLASYVGMFLVLRRELPHFPLRELDDRRWAFARDWLATLLQSILPFFVIYAAWGMINDDILAYGIFGADQLLAHIDVPGYANTPLSVPFGVVSVSLIVGAFVLRWLLGRFRHRLPGFMTVPAVYLEAVWVLVALFVLRGLMALIPGWLATRRMFAGFADLVTGLRASLTGFAAVQDAIGWLFGVIGTVVVQPLAWLALAGVVFAGVLVTIPVAQGGERLQKTTARWQRLPRWARRLLELATSDLRDRWEPIATILRLVRRSGPIALGSYLLAFAVVTAAEPWLRYAIPRVLGPHTRAFWVAWDEPMTLGIQLVLVPIQLALVAAMFDRAISSAGVGAAGVSAAAAPSDPGPAPRTAAARPAPTRGSGTPRSVDTPEPARNRS